MREFKLGIVAKLRISAVPLAGAGSIVVWLALGAVAIGVLSLTLWEAIVGGLVGAALHWVSNLAHHLGHAWAAHRAGYPMAGVRFGTFGLLGTSLYPPDEPELPPAVHIRRALGGPMASLLVSVVAALIALAMSYVGGVLWWAAVFFFLDNFLVFTFGALLPLGFNDGSTLLEWRGKRSQ